MQWEVKEIPNKFSIDGSWGQVTGQVAQLSGADQASFIDFEKPYAIKNKKVFDVINISLFLWSLDRCSI